MVGEGTLISAQLLVLAVFDPAVFLSAMVTDRLSLDPCRNFVISIRERGRLA
jgi:hypothetical protein